MLGTARLEGQVVDALHQPVANAQVVAELDGEEVARTHSDASGTFVFAKVPQQFVVVRTKSGAPVPGARVWIDSHESWRDRKPLVTDREGRYGEPGLPPFPYGVNVQGQPRSLVEHRLMARQGLDVPLQIEANQVVLDSGRRAPHISAQS